MSYRHIVIIGNSYEINKRIALHFCDEDIEIVNKKLEKLRKDTKNEFPLAMHTIYLDSNKWDDLVNYDAFFKDILVIEDEKKFVKLLMSNKDLSSLDVAEYILSKGKCSHTRIEKLTYLCYADYLCKYKEKLFNDKIYAFQYGPIVKDVYDKFNHKYGGDVDKVIPSLEQYDLPIKSRILISKDGLRKIKTIDESIERYAKYSTEKLVELTHRPNTPWSKNYKGHKSWSVILDKDILNYHCSEEV